MLQSPCKSGRKSGRLLGRQLVAAGKGNPKNQQRRSFPNGAFAQSAAIGFDYLSGSEVVFLAGKHYSAKPQLTRFFQAQPEKLCTDAAAPAVRADGITDMAAVIVGLGQLQADINDTDKLLAVARQEGERGDSVRFSALPNPLQIEKPIAVA